MLRGLDFLHMELETELLPLSHRSDRLTLRHRYLEPKVIRSIFRISVAPFNSFVFSDNLNFFPDCI